MSIKIKEKYMDVIINGKKYIRADSEPFEIITIEEVRPQYQQNFKWLYLGFEMPLMQFRPGDKIKIVKVSQ